jgi:CheY-like chemotaxis protein
VLLETRHVLTNSSSLSATSNVAARFRALVVDDSMINSKVLSKMLSKLECLQIESANHRGAKALDYLQSLQALEDANLLLPNLIISDLSMPEMNGYELLRRESDRESWHGRLIRRGKWKQNASRSALTEF